MKKKVATTFNITEENLMFLAKQAEKEGRSKSSFLNVLLDNIREQSK